MSKVLLIDGMNAIFRANIKFGPPQEGPSYIMIYNFFRSLRATISKFQPSKIFFCLEGTSNFRYSIFKDYKANRILKKASSDRDSINTQRDIIIDLLKYLPITLVKANRFEADDVIYSLCKNMNGEDITILSSDTDFIQLLQCDLNIKIFSPHLKDFVQPPKFHYLAWKSLSGDKSDNIPGLVSNNKAISLLEDPKLLEELLSSEENRSRFNLNKELIELRIVPDDELIFTDGETDFEKLFQEFEKMELQSLLIDKYWLSFKNTFDQLCINKQ